MNAKSSLRAALLVTLSVLGAACSTTTLPSSHPFANARLDMPGALDRSFGRPGGTDAHAGIARR